jgi:hypothetical protein
MPLGSKIDDTFSDETPVTMIPEVQELDAVSQASVAKDPLPAEYIWAQSVGHAKMSCMMKIIYRAHGRWTLLNP